MKAHEMVAEGFVTEAEMGRLIVERMRLRDGRLSEWPLQSENAAQRRARVAAEVAADHPEHGEE